MRGLLRWLFRLGLVVLAITTIAVVFKSWQMRDRHLDGASLTDPVDAILVLGAGVNGDMQLAYSSRRRVAGAVALLQQDKARVLITSGGPGGNHPETPAGDLMRDYAISLGARPEQVISEPKAVSTFENIRFAFEIAEEQGFTTVAILSDAYHLTRAQALATHFGRPQAPLIAVAGVEKEPWPMHGWYFIREAMAWWFNVGKVGGWEMLRAIGVETEQVEELIR